MPNNIVQNKLHEYFEQRGFRDYRNGWMKGDCPDCGKENKYGVHLEDDRTNCFSCGYRVRPLRALMALEGFNTLNQAYLFLRAFEGAEYIRREDPKIETRAAEFPPGYHLISLGDSEVAKLARNYMKKRGFSLNSLEMAGIGYCDEGEYFGCIIIPYYRLGKLVYYTGRRFINWVGEKFKNPRMEDFGVGKSTLIYNVDSLQMYKHIRVVESATNALTMRDRTIAIGGKAISDYQLNCLMKSPCTSISIILDPDAYSEAIALGLRIVNYKQIKVIKLPDGYDANDLGYKEVRRIEKSTKYQTWGELYSLNLRYGKEAQPAYN